MFEINANEQKEAGIGPLKNQCSMKSPDNFIRTQVLVSKLKLCQLYNATQNIHNFELFRPTRLWSGIEPYFFQQRVNLFTIGLLSN